MLSSLMICTALLNPGMPLRDLSISLEPQTRQEIMNYAFAGAMQSAIGISQKARFRGPSQKFYTPEDRFVAEARNHLEMSEADRNANYLAIAERLATSVRLRHVGGFDGLYSVRTAGTVRTIARDLRNAVEHQQTISSEIAELFFSKLLTDHTASNSRLRITYIVNGKVIQKEVSYMGPFASSNAVVASPKFEFLPTSGGAGARSPFAIEAAMIIGIQKI